MKVPNVADLPWELYKNKELPRYLYTITTKANYESMCKDGFIKIAQDPLRPRMRGIFMFDLRNLTKRWTKNFFFRRKDMATELLVNVSDKSPELVVLKIPTKSLEGTLRIRSLNYLFKHCDRYHMDNHLDIGLPANMQRRLTQHKEAIEYIYKDDLPIDKVEKIGELYIEDKRSLNRGLLNIKDLLSKLFQGSPQHRTIEQMK